MRCAIIYFLILSLTCKSVLFAQQASYASFHSGEQFKIAGKIGNSIHVWGLTIHNGLLHDRISLTLYCFSANLLTRTAKQVFTGESFIKKLEFQFADSFYYANMLYGTSFNKRLMLKIDQQGNSTDVTAIPGLWDQTSSAANLPHLNNLSANNTSLFSITKDIVNADSSLDKESIVLIPGEKFRPGEKQQQLTIRKVNRITGELIKQRIFTAGKLSFSSILITTTENSVVACAFAKANAMDKGKKKYKGPYLALLKLDTNLVIINSRVALLKETTNDLYSLMGVFPLHNRVVLLSTGQYFHQNNNFGSAGNAVPGPPLIAGYYVTNSLRVLLADEKNDIVIDTLIERGLDRDHLSWENSFITASKKGIDFFCQHQYTKSKTGVTHFTIDSNGKMVEKEMLVALNYTYNLSAAYSLAPGLLLVPTFRKGKTGLMKLVYEPVE